MRSPVLSRPLLAAGLLCLSSVLLASCASDDRPRRGALPRPPAPVAGEAACFGGQLVASIYVGAEFRRPEGGGESGGRGEREGRGGRRGGGGGGMSFGGGAAPMQFGGGGGGPRGARGDGPPGESGGNVGGGARLTPANGVPLTIHLKLRNTSAAPVEVVCRDFASPLGNFVVQPTMLPVPAGETAEFSPITSFVQGDLPDELPVTLTLRIAGKTEKQIVVLRPVPRETAPPTVER